MFELPFDQICFLGCDPGRSGAFALVILDDQARCAGFEAIRFKWDPWREIRRWLAARRQAVRCAGIEMIVPHPRRNKDGEEIKLGASTMGKLMEHYGICQGLLIAADIPRVYATPKRWHNEFGLAPGSTKNDTKKLARGYFPAQSDRIFHWNAEAILLGLYAARNYACADL